MGRQVLVALALLTIVLAQTTNPIIQNVKETTIRNLLYAIAQNYCKTKVAWETLSYSINNIYTALQSVQNDYQNLVNLLEPGGSLYNFLMNVSTTYVTNFNTLKNYMVQFLASAQGLSISLGAASASLAGAYPQNARSKLLDNYNNQIKKDINDIQYYLSNYMALEAMQSASLLADIVHKYVVDAYLKSNTTPALLQLSVGNATYNPPPEKTWLGLAACATDLANNSFTFCAIYPGTTLKYERISATFQSTLYQQYAKPLGAPCPLNSAQIHTYMVSIWNLYANYLYPYYIEKIWPYEAILINTKPMLIAIITRMSNDLLSPIFNSLYSIGKNKLPGAMASCMKLVTTNVNLNMLNGYDLRNPFQLTAFLTNAAQAFQQVYQGALEAIRCLQYYEPIYQRATLAYLNALKERFKALSGGIDVEQWAQENGIPCTATTSITYLTDQLKAVIDTYYNILNPSSTTSFINNLNITQPLGVFAPNQILPGPADSPCT